MVAPIANGGPDVALLHFCHFRGILERLEATPGQDSQVNARTAKNNFPDLATQRRYITVSDYADQEIATMANINAAAPAPALRIENAPGGVLVDGVLFPALGPCSLVWEGPSRSGRFHFLLAHSVTEGLFTLTVGTCQDPYRFLAHPMLTRDGEPRGYPLDTAVSLLRTFQARW